MNPLVTIQFRIPFDQIRAEHVEPAIAELLAEARASQKALSESTGPRTFENTLLALEAVTEKLDATLITRDARLASASARLVSIELF